MSNRKEWNGRPNAFLAIWFFVACAVFAAGGAFAQQDAETIDSAVDERTSVSRHVVQGGRDSAANAVTTTEEFDALATDGSRAVSATRGDMLKPGGISASKRARNDFWIFDADVVLFNDDDNDGYYHGIDLLFDADTIYASVKVYAVVYLSLDLGPWNEYGITKDFRIIGASADDEYVLVTELMSGYPTGDYDLLIELFDANDNTFLASFGPEDSSAMSFLPLEDFNRDEPFVRAPVAVSRGGGGSSGAWTIGLLLLLLVVRAGHKIWRHRNDTLVRIDEPPPCWQDHSTTRRS